MPVANSFSDPVNSAAQFIDGAVKGGAESSVTLQAADANNSPASLVPKDRKSSDEDFDAVLALLLNGGVPPLPPPSVQLHIETKAAMVGTADATSASSGADSNTAGNSTFVSVGQLLLQSRDFAASQTTASPGLVKATTTLSGNIATLDTARSANTVELSPANPAATTVAPTAPVTSNMTVTVAVSVSDSPANVDRTSSATTQISQGNASTQLSGDAKILTPQVLPVPGTGAKVDAQTVAVNVSVLGQSFESVAAKPLSKDMVQALERIGRPPQSEVVLDPESQPTTLETKLQISTLPDSGLSGVVDPVAAKPILPLKPSLAAQTATVSSTASTASFATALNDSPQSGPQLSSLTNPKALVSSFTTTSESAETLLQPLSSKSAEAGSIKSIKATQSESVSTDSTSAPISSALEQLQPSVESLKRRGLSGVHAVRSDRPASQVSSASDLAAAKIQSGLIPSVSPHSVPDLAASISAKMRQPLTSQVSQAIMDHVERNGVRQNESLSVRLDPPELGEMTIQLSKTDEGLAVRVTAREAVTMDMLFTRGQDIESQLRGQNMNLKSLEFRREDKSNSGFSQGEGQRQQQNNSSRRSEILLNQIRGGTRGLSPISNSQARSVTSESTYGLSFRA